MNPSQNDIKEAGMCWNIGRGSRAVREGEGAARQKEGYNLFTYWVDSRSCCGVGMPAACSANTC